QGGREFAAQYSPRPLQGQKEGSLPFNRQLATWCSAPRNRRWLSVAPGYNETSRLTQKVGSFIKQIKVLNGLIGQHSGLVARAVDTQNGNKGRLADRRILADRLAHHG